MVLVIMNMIGMMKNVFMVRNSGVKIYDIDLVSLRLRTLLLDIMVFYSYYLIQR
jgi:hypothetical protein